MSRETYEMRKRGREQMYQAYKEHEARKGNHSITEREIRQRIDKRAAIVDAKKDR